jgi:hypothetical protein
MKGVLKVENKKYKNGDLRVWWIPQVPMKSFTVDVKDIYEAKKILNVLADYDVFQFENKIKPDYSNAGGLMIWDDTSPFDDEEDCWCDWYDEETGMDFDEYFDNIEEIENE